MCGIGGVFHLSGKQVNTDLLLEMNQKIRHRGPDDEGILLINTSSDRVVNAYGPDTDPQLLNQLAPPENTIGANLGFAFRRLSILDLSPKGHQPMPTIKGNCWIVFNGEIYNYLELRAELEALGYVFNSHTDTEVILNAYLAWGVDCQQRFMGMWSFAIWDSQKKRLFCSRDRFGIKPFYYYFDGETFLFGSEVKQFLVYPINKEINKEVIYKSLKIGAYLINSNNTFYQSIHILPHGHYLIVENGGVKIEPYYRLDPSTFASFKGTFQEAVEIYRELFQNTIRLHMRSDVEVGITLSGGLDSTAILASAHGLTNKTIKTFSSYFTHNPLFDERKWINVMIDAFNVNPFFYSATADEIMENFSEMTWHHDYPIYGSSPAVNYLLMKHIKKSGVGVVLSGQGKDELAGGYKHSFYRYYAYLLKSGKWKNFVNEFPTYLRDNNQGGLFGKISKIGASFFFKESLLYKLEASIQENVLSKSFNDFKIFDNIEDLPTDKLSNFLYNNMMSTSVQTLLHFEDRNSMASSLESRVPFLDHNLAEFLFSLPPEFKNHKNLGKYIHRRAMEGIVPDEVITRKEKIGYLAPGEQYWMKNEMKAFVSGIFSSTDFKNRDIYNHKLILSKYKNMLAVKTGDEKTLWNIMSLEIWFKSQGM
jgi:asparagine synthase (glutamine-hydrolysing)